MNLFEKQSKEFAERHIGPDEKEKAEMLEEIGLSSIEELISNTIPHAIQMQTGLEFAEPMNEFEYLVELKKIAEKNKVFKSYIGQGYYDTIVPNVILRNLFQNPGWYTQYTPYQAEISQGRLESLLNFQTMVSDLTSLPIANASLLDEGTAAAEAMAMLLNHKNRNHEHLTAPKFFVDDKIFSQTKGVLITRAKPIGVELVFGNFNSIQFDDSFFGGIIQYPNSEGSVEDYRDFIKAAHKANAKVVMATDLMALSLLTSPGELGADVAIGSSQRFGVPLGYGGPHAAFFATKDEFKRNIPGRIIGVSIDAQGNRCLRMALQTREQHIRREKATSNICTAQALLANMAAMYAVYHGAEGLKNIAKRIAVLTNTLAIALAELGYSVISENYFDTITLQVDETSIIRSIAEAHGINFYYPDKNFISISIDETTTQSDILNIAGVFAFANGNDTAVATFDNENTIENIPATLTRTSSFLLHPVFNTHHSETELMRYLKVLENKDLSLTASMIPLGSCTMKLNAATELIPVSWPEFSRIHPFAPAGQTKGYQIIINELEEMLSKITGFAACSLQPNSGAQGEFAGLLTIKAYHADRNNDNRNIILIPISAHGTNPASAVMAGFKVVVTMCDSAGNIDVKDLTEKVEKFKDRLAGLMVTYPSTHGVFEESIKEICDLIHENGGLVYMDGANMNAQVGITSPGIIGADVCHLNLHKTFAIPHGGGGPGMGPICVNEKLKKYLLIPDPSPQVEKGKLVENGALIPAPSPQAGKGEMVEKVDIENSFSKDKGVLAPPPLGRGGGEGKGRSVGAVSSAPYGSASILLVSYGYIKMLGSNGLRKATEYAILNANYMKARLKKHFNILYTGKGGTCAHEFIVDLRPFKNTSGIEAEDVAKRLMDYGFHAPTLSFPVAGTIMIEPTESENKAELDRFCDAMIAIHEEIKLIETGKSDKAENVLKNAPHTLTVITANEWNKSYTRQQAAFPLEYLRLNKFWPAVSRVNNTYGDRNLICTCDPVESYIQNELVAS